MQITTARQSSREVQIIKAGESNREVRVTKPGRRTQFGEEGGVLLAQGREDLLRKGERRVGVARAYELDEALLLQVERQLRMLLQDLRDVRWK